eukprot:170465-Lingulodinium_polyedra.AAC.1
MGLAARPAWFCAFGPHRDPGRVATAELVLAWVDACRSDPGGARVVGRGWVERLRGRQAKPANR